MLPKKHNYDKKIFRLVAILNKLNSNKTVLSHDLAVEFNVSIRSIQRDLELLNMAGFPLMMPEKGVYSFTEGFSLKKSMITNEEASLLAFLYDIVRSRGKEFEDSFHDILEKVLYYDGQSAYYAKLPHGIKLSEKTPFIKELEASIKNLKQLEIVYLAKGGEVYFKVHPLKIVFFDGFWYLLCKKHSGRPILKLRVDKILKLKTLDASFTFPNNIKTMLDKSVNAWLSEKRDIKVVLKIDKEVAAYFKKKLYFPCQKILKEEKDGSIVIECSASQHMEVRPTILCWMPHIRVLEPESLKNEIRKIVQNYRV